MARTGQLYFLGGLFLLFFLATLKDLIMQKNLIKESSAFEENVKLNPKIGKEKAFAQLRHTLGRSNLKVLYCYSCGYRKAFDEYSSLIQERYPDILVTGENYQSPWVKTALAQLIAVGKLILIVCILTNVNPFEYLGYPTPSFWFWFTQRKMYGCMMIYFLSNLIEGQLLSTGAFEIFFNDTLVWSKLEAGRIPSPQELFQIIENNRSFKMEGSMF